MKKNKIILFVIILLILVLVFIITNSFFSNEEKFIKRYINSSYANEDFIIISQKKIGTVNDCGRQNNKDIYEYIVKSNDTNTEFSVIDTYELNGYCVRSAEDNYKTKAMKKYIEEFGDKRISVDKSNEYSDDVNIKVDYSNFNSLDDLVKVLYKFKNFYEVRKPFTINTLFFYVYVNVYESETYLNEFTLSSHNVNVKSENITESTIYKNIEDILKNI